MPRKPNYGLNKHRKEQDRKAKKDAKRLEREQRREERTASDGGDAPAQPGVAGDADAGPDNQPVPNRPDLSA